MTAKSSDVLIIGSGPSALLCALLASKTRSVTIMEKNSKEFRLGKRILVSGNGRANFFNQNLLNEEFYAPELREIVFDGRNYAKETLDYLTNEIHLSYLKEGDLFYPYFNRSECVHTPLTEAVMKRCTVIKGTALKKTEDGVLFLNEEGKKETITYKTLVIATGGRSYDRDDFSYSLLDSLDARYQKFEPALCPIKVKEKIPAYLSGSRLKGTLSLFADGKFIRSEEGELIFKDDGLSGIALFNLTIDLHQCLNQGKRNFTFAFDYTTLEGNLFDDISSYPLFLKRYLKERGLQPKETLNFTFDSFYPFKNSQISYGGILLEEINPHYLSLKRDDKIIVLGETLNQNLPCGGYNIGLAMIEGYKAGTLLNKD